MKVNRSSLLAGALLLASASPAFAAEPRPAAQVAWQQLAAPLGPDATIRWNASTGAPDNIVLRPFDAAPKPGNVMLSATQARDLARAFTESHRELFGLRDGIDALVPADDVIDPSGAHHVWMEQTYLGVPVAFQGYRASLTPGGQVQVINGRFRPDLSLDVHPTLTASQAIADALGSLKLSPEGKTPTARLVVYAVDATPHLAYEVSSVHSGFSASWKVFVDASNGRTLKTIDMIAHAEAAPTPVGGKTGVGGKTPSVPGARIGGRTPTATPLVTEDDGGGGGGGGGSGCSYPSGNVYRTNHCDGFYSNEFLDHLTSSTTTQGSYIKVQPAVSAYPAAYDPCAQFNYTPTDAHQAETTAFDDVNLYYHLDRILSDYFASHFFFYYNYGAYQAYTHVPDSDGSPDYGNGFFDFDTREFYFGHGCFTYKNGLPPVPDPAKSNWIIDHESGHAVIYQNGIQGGNFPAETAAMHEGLADYFAASYNNSPSLGKCSMWYGCDYQAARPLDSSPATFNYNNASLTWTYCDGLFRTRDDPHVLGMVLSGAMWDIRTAFGASTVDSWVYNATRFVGYYPDFSDFVQEIYYFAGSSYHSQLQCLFAARGLDAAPALASAPTGLSATDATVSCAVNLGWNASANAVKYRLNRNGVFWKDVTGTSTSDPAAPLTVYTSYAVAAVNACGAVSGFSPPVNGRPSPVVTAPTNVVASDDQTNQVTVTWTPGTGGGAQRVKRDGTTIADNLATNVGQYVDTAPPAGQHNYSVVGLACSKEGPPGYDMGSPLAPAPTVSLTGPTALDVGQVGTYTAHVTGGQGTITYQWYKAWDCDNGQPKPSNAIELLPPCKEFEPFGLGQATQQTSSSVQPPTSFWIRCDVTDVLNRTATSGNTYYVHITGSINNSPSAALTPAREESATQPVVPGIHPLPSNPVRGSTAVEFGMTRAGRASLAVFDVAGRRRLTLTEGQLPIGIHNFSWNSSALANGVYVYSLKTDGKIESRTFVILH